jgi:hypothetical protein
MKSTALNTKCLSSLRCAARAGKSSAAGRAHTPLRRRTAPARVEALPAPQGLDHPAYLEQVGPVQAKTVIGCLPRVLHVDTETGTAAVLANLLGSAVHVTHVATLAEARVLLQREIFSLVILDPALPDGDAKALLPLLADTPLLVYSDLQPEWREVMSPPFLSKSWTTARQLWTRMSTMLWNTSALSAGD